MTVANYLDYQWQTTGVLLGVVGLMRLRSYRCLPGVLLAAQAAFLTVSTVSQRYYGKELLERQIRDLTAEAHRGMWQAVDPYKRLAIEDLAAELGYASIYNRGGDLRSPYGIPVDLGLFWSFNDEQKGREFDSYRGHLRCLREPAPREVSFEAWVHQYFFTICFTMVCTRLSVGLLRTMTL